MPASVSNIISNNFIKTNNIYLGNTGGIKEAWINSNKIWERPATELVWIKELSGKLYLIKKTFANETTINKWTVYYSGNGTWGYSWGICKMDNGSLSPVSKACGNNTNGSSIINQGTYLGKPLYKHNILLSTPVILPAGVYYFTIGNRYDEDLYLLSGDCEGISMEEWRAYTASNMGTNFNYVSDKFSLEVS